MAAKAAGFSWEEVMAGKVAAGAGEEVTCSVRLQMDNMMHVSVIIHLGQRLPH